MASRRIRRITFSAVSEATAVLDADPVVAPESGSDFTFAAAADSADTEEAVAVAADDVDAAEAGAVEAMASAADDMGPKSTDAMKLGNWQVF